MEFLSLQRAGLATVLCAGFDVGCYDAELDVELDGIYFCDVDRECPLGSECIDRACRFPAEDRQPVLDIVSPESLEVFEQGEQNELPLMIAGARLTLSSGGAPGEEDEDSGYIEVLVDGVVVQTVTAGELEDGIMVDALAMPSTAGLHHVSLVARRLDGEPFNSPRARVDRGFWIDDGMEQIGILRPAPASVMSLSHGDELEIEVVSLNFTFVNPGFVSSEEVTAPGLGYANLYIDAAVPGCLPACNFEQQNTLIPAGLSRVNRIQSERGVSVPNEIGTVNIQVVAQTLSHTPYARESAEGDFVFHSVPVQSTVGVGP